jgi:hypothetical protein
VIGNTGELGPFPFGQQSQLRGNQPQEFLASFGGIQHEALIEDVVIGVEGVAPSVLGIRRLTGAFRRQKGVPARL